MGTGTTTTTRITPTTASLSDLYAACETQWAVTGYNVWFYQIPCIRLCALMTGMRLSKESPVRYGCPGLVPGRPIFFERKRRKMETNKTFLQKIETEMYTRTGIHCAYAKYCGFLTLEELFTTDSVYIAACHCAAGFRDKRDTQAFMDAVWDNSRKLAEKVKAGKFKPTYYRERIIQERGKPRLIKPPAFECKVVQKVLCDYLLRPLLEPKMISTNFASVRGRGTSALYEDVLGKINRYGHPGCIIIMTDFSGYFASIDTEKLGEELGRYIQDERVVDLFRKFCPESFGLSLGNETSQVPASFFPSKIDHYMKDRLGCKTFARYMDDSFVLAESMEGANRYLQAIQGVAKDLSLTLKPEKIKIVPYGRDFSFCKERYIFNKEKGYYYRLQNPQIARNETRKLKAMGAKIRAGAMSQKAAEVQFRGVIGNIGAHPNTRKTVERLSAVYRKEIGEEGTIDNQCWQKNIIRREQ